MSDNDIEFVDDLDTVLTYAESAALLMAAHAALEKAGDAYRKALIQVTRAMNRIPDSTDSDPAVDGIELAMLEPDTVEDIIETFERGLNKLAKRIALLPERR
jgi:hypothetical protein